MRSVYLVLVLSCLSSNALAETPWPANILNNDSGIQVIFHHQNAYSAYLVLDQEKTVPYLKGIAYFSPISNEWVTCMLTDELKKTLRSAPVSRLAFDEKNLRYLITHQGAGVSTFDVKTKVWSHKI